MKFSQIALTILLSAVVAFAAGRYAAPAPNGAAARESAYDRVLRTNTLHCGYNVAAPYLTKDPATGALGGIWYDQIETVADHLGLKVEWAAEVGLGEIPVALDTGKIDMFCGGLWTAGKRVRAVDFLKPTAYEPILAYVRPDDHRFDADIKTIDDAKVTISTIDGEGGGLVAGETFPHATLVSLPQSAGYADMYNQVVARKADIVLAAPSGAAAFIKNNPGALRPLITQPIRVFPLALAVRYGEDQLRDMFNQAQDDIIADGTMEKIIASHETNPGDFWRVSSPYIQPRQP